jgi:hypothetical protein
MTFDQWRARRFPLAAVVSGFKLEILGERRAAALPREPLLDPEGKRMRSA